MKGMGASRTISSGVAGMCLVLLLAALANAQVSNPDRSLLQDAARAISAGEFDRAETDLQAALRTSPGDYRVLDLLGILRAQQQRDHDAEKIFKDVIAKKPDFASAYVHLGLLYVQMSRPDEAVPQLQHALSLVPGRNDASEALLGIWREQARSAIKAGDSEKALALLLEARKLAPENPDVQFEFGMAALRMHLLPDAISAFQQVLKVRNDDVSALYGLGRAFMDQSKFDDARQAFARYVALRPDDASGHYALGMSYAALQKTADAGNEFQKSISLQPIQTEAYFRLGLLELDSKDLDSAAREFHQALDRDPQHAAALAALGRLEIERKNYEESIALLNKAIARNPDLREAHYYLGLAYARMGRKQESADEFEIATRLEHEETQKEKTVFTILDPGTGTESK